MKNLFVALLIILSLLVVTSIQCLADDNVIHGCVGRITGKLRVVDDPDKCKWWEHSISWNVAGQQPPGDFPTDLGIPDGLDDSTRVTISIDSDDPTYTVPSGKNLYVSDLYSPGIIVFTINGVQSGSHRRSSFSSMYVFGENMVITTSGDPINFNGFLVDKKTEFLVHDLSASDFTVPYGKLLIVTSFHNPTCCSSIDEVEFLDVSIAHSGQILSGSTAFIGYFIDY